MSTTTHLLTIGELSSVTGVPSSTLRFWERRGLLAPERRVGGKRRYTEEARLLVALLRRGQLAAMTLGELKVFTSSRPRGWREVLMKKLAEVERRRDELENARVLLTHALACQHEDLLSCPKFKRQLDTFGASQPKTAAQLLEMCAATDSTST